LNILFLNQYYPPDTAATAYVAQRYAYALAEEHKVTVLAGRPSYNPLERYPWHFLHQSADGKLLVERVGSTSFERHLMKGRVLNYFSYLMLMTVRALTIKADALVCMTDPPLIGIAAATVATLQQRPFVYFIQDLHPDMALASGLVRENALVSLWEKIHRWALRKAKVIVVLGEDMKRLVASKGIDEDKIKVVRLGASIDESLMAPRQHPKTLELRCGFSFTVFHGGNLGFYGAWETLIDAARCLNEEDIGFIFIGDGAAKGKIEKLASSCKNVRFMPFRPANEISYVMAAGDLHVVAIKRGLEGMVVPSKFYSILSAGRPVLALAPESSDVAQIVGQEQCGIVVNPDSPEALAKAILDIKAQPEKLQMMGRRARSAARKYNKKKGIERFAKLISSMARANKVEV